MSTAPVTNRILIVEALAPGLGINGGKRVCASAVAHTIGINGLDELVDRELRRAGRAVIVEVKAEFWVEVLTGGADEAVLTNMLEAFWPVAEQRRQAAKAIQDRFGR